MAARLITATDHIQFGEILRADGKHLQDSFIFIGQRHSLALHDRVSALDAGKRLDFGDQPVDLTRFDRT